MDFDPDDLTYDGDDSVTGTNAGTYDLVLDPEKFVNGNDNYDITVGVEKGTLTIDKRKVTVTVTGNKDTAEYDGKAHDVSGYNVSSNDDLFSEDSISYNGNATASGTNAGTYGMDLQPGQFANTDDNFDITFEVEDGTLEITRKKVTVTADDKSKYVGADDPELTWTVDGLVEGDSENAITVAITRAVGEKVGEYDIIPSGDAEQGNYEVSYVMGKFTIEKITPVPPTPDPDPDPDPTPKPDPDPTPTPTPDPNPNPNPNVNPDPAPTVVPFNGPENPQNINPDDVPLDPGDTIEDPETPLVPTIPIEANWALINLLCTIASVIISLLVLLAYLGKSKKEKEQVEPDTDEADAKQKEVNKKGILRIIDIVPALTAVITFLITEDMSSTMVLTDHWTILMVVILIVDVMIALFTKKTTKDADDNDDTNGAAGNQQNAQA